jgi:tRNA 2-thiouridine synthesizing protein A
MVDRVLDVTGLNCPLPLLRTERAIGDLPVGAVLRVLTTDPGAPDDFPAFCARSGHDLLTSEVSAGVYRFTIKRCA